jgi:hypothetical protein
MSPVSASSSRVIYDALKECGVRLISALPETWLVHLIRMAEENSEMILLRLANEKEGVGISAGAHLAGMKSAMLMQNHGFLASVDGIVSCVQLYHIPPLLLHQDGEVGRAVNLRRGRPLPQPARTASSSSICEIRQNDQCDDPEIPATIIRKGRNRPTMPPRNCSDALARGAERASPDEPVTRLVLGLHIT